MSEIDFKNPFTISLKNVFIDTMYQYLKMSMYDSKANNKNFYDIFKYDLHKSIITPKETYYLAKAVFLGELENKESSYGILVKHFIKCNTNTKLEVLDNAVTSMSLKDRCPKNAIDLRFIIEVEQILQSISEVFDRTKFFNDISLALIKKAIRVDCYEDFDKDEVARGLYMVSNFNELVTGIRSIFLLYKRLRYAILDPEESFEGIFTNTWISKEEKKLREGSKPKENKYKHVSKVL